MIEIHKRRKFLMNKQNNSQSNNGTQTGGSDPPPENTRRRGELLENAILQAAWDELQETGYAHLTMDGVAARARTNKNAVYRRWPGKPELVVAALHKHLPRISDEIPDTGSLRSDVLAMLHRITEPMQAIGAETIQGILVDFLGKQNLLNFFTVKKERKDLNEDWNARMMVILKRAKERGEISSLTASKRILSLPIDLLRSELLITFGAVSDETVKEIVDQVFLPLVHT
jgi:Transcriptional regulator